MYLIDFGVPKWHLAKTVHLHGMPHSEEFCNWIDFLSEIGMILKLVSRERTYKSSLLFSDEKPSLTLSQVLPQQLRNESTPGPPSRENSMFRVSIRISSDHWVHILHSKYIYQNTLEKS